MPQFHVDTAPIQPSRVSGVRSPARPLGPPWGSESCLCLGLGTPTVKGGDKSHPWD